MYLIIFAPVFCSAQKIIYCVSYWGHLNDVTGYYMRLILFGFIHGNKDYY